MNVHSISAFGDEHDGDGDGDAAVIPDIPMRKSSRHLSVSELLTTPPSKAFRNKPRFVEDIDGRPYNQSQGQQPPSAVPAAAPPATSLR